MSNFTVYQLNW